MVLPQDPTNDILQLSAVQAAALIRDGALKSETLVGACLQRIDATDDKLGAWEWLDADLAVRQAREMDRLRWHGRATGPLHGVPVGIKDIIDTRDFPTERGTAACRGRRPRRDAFVIDRLRDAGAVILGKTVTTELAFMHPGRTVNPHNSARTPGGSSSGSAAAVAAMQVPLAIGSQTNGSVVRPASFCGVFGLKPSFGTISRSGALRTCGSLDHLGVFSRHLEDSALLVDVIGGRDSGDAATFERPRPRLLEGCFADPPIEPSLVWIEAPYFDQLSDDVQQGFEDVLALLEPRVDRLPPPVGFDGLIAAHKTIQDYELARNLRRLVNERGEHLSEKILAAIGSGQRISAQSYRSAKRSMAAAKQYFEKFFHDYDAIVAPSALGEAPPIELGTGDPICCTIWTLCGLPALSMPVLTGAIGLPVGVQLIGGPEEDDRLMRTANWILRTLMEKPPDDTGLPS